MSLEQRGTPPYTVWSSELTEIEAHPGYADTFSAALLRLFDLTNAGLDLGGPTTKRLPRIEDSTKVVVVDMEKKEDVQLLRDIDEHPEKYPELFP